MAQRRMFNKTITNNDNFLEMPDSSQNLYFHLSMNADDDGFIDNWKSIMRMTGHKEDDLKVLIAKQYIIPFESGVIVIRHWRLNNYLRRDRYTSTSYIKELNQLTVDNNNIYNLDTKGIPSNNPDKISIDKISKDNILIVDEDKKNSLLNTTKEIITYMNELAGTDFRYTTKKTQSLINARLKEGFTVDDIKDVIYYKYHKWYLKPIEFKNGQKSDYYFRPNTLFSTNFEGYLEEYKKQTGD